MIVLAGAMLSAGREGVSPGTRRSEWAAVLVGATLVFTAFVWEYSRLAVTSGLFSDPPGAGRAGRFLDGVSRHIPSDFNWFLFLLGEILIIGAVIVVWKMGRSAPPP